MIFFSIKKQTKKEEKPRSLPKESRSVSEGVRSFDIIIRPRITEKAAIVSENNVYVFTVKRNATKKSVAEAIESFYGVVPTTVRIAKVPKKPKRSRLSRVMGSTKELKKAYVQLKKGDTIQLN